ncbi:glycosyltransferase [Streptomyces antibioticus]
MAPGCPRPGRNQGTGADRPVPAGGVPAAAADGASANNALLEALACGTPAVVTDIGGIRHYAGQGPAALLVPPGDAGAAASAADLLLT